MKYTFVTIERCNMCGAPANRARVLGKRMNRSQGKRPTSLIGITTTVVQCPRCELIFTNPMPVPEHISQHYGTPPESYWKRPTYFEIDPEYFRHQIDTFYRLHATGEGLRALDVGAGIGKGMIAMRNRGLDVFGLEPSEPFYQRALEKMNIPPDKLIHSSLEDADYPAEHFDFITFGAVLEHLYDPSAAIVRTLGWLRPNGLIHIEVPSSSWLTNRIYNVIYRLQGLDYVGNLSPMHPPFHLYEFGLKSFRYHAQAHHYTIAYYKYMVMRTFLPVILTPIVKPYMERTNTGMQLEIWLRKPA